MKKVVLGKSNLEITSVFYGGIVSMQDGQDKSDQYVEYAIKKGINYFDVAPSYQDAEEKLGNSLIPYRKKVLLACKTAERDAENAKRELERSFELLHTDYFDNYQMHGIVTVEEVERAFAKDGAFEVYLRGKEEGYLKHLGITCHTEEAALRALELYDFETVLFPTNWGLNLHKGFGNRLLTTCKEKNIGRLGMKSLIHRAWNSEDERQQSAYPKSWCKPIDISSVELRVAAMKYAYSMGAMALVPPGDFENFSFAVEHSDEILQPLTDSERELLEKEVKLIGNCHFF